MYHVGDITKLDGHTLAPVECITGGSPCQDLSIAGKREGLAGERSGLFMEMIRVIREMREEDIKNGRTNEHIRPRFVIWENVAGAFTSNRGQDFRAVLEEFCRIKESEISIPMPDNGKWAHSGAIVSNGFSLAWRLMDAQYFGVPQRRKRIALVVDYGGENAADILFTGEPFVGDITDGRFGKVLPVGEGLRRNTTQSRQEGQGASRSAENGIGESDNSYTLKIRGGSDTYIKPDGSIGTAGKGALIPTEQSATLGVSQDQTLFTPTPINTMVASRTTDEKRTTFGVGKPGDPQFSITSAHEHAVAYGLVGVDTYNQKITGDVAAPLNATSCDSPSHSGPSVLAYAFEPGISKRGNVENRIVEEKTPTLRAKMGDNQIATAYGLGRDSFNSGENAKYSMSIEEEMQPPITERGAGGVCSITQ